MNNPLKHQFLAQRYQELENVLEEIKKVCEGLSQDEFNWKPSPQKWSIAECMQHLLIVYGKYQIQLPQNITPLAPKDPSRKTVKSSFMGRIFKSFVNPEKKRKTPAPKSLQPPTNSDYPLILQTQFMDYLQELMRFIAKTDELALDLNKIKIKSSVTALIKFNLGDYFEIESMHNRLHLKQMKRVLEEMSNQKMEK